MSSSSIQATPTVRSALVLDAPQVGALLFLTHGSWCWIGPAESLFTSEFIQTLYRALRDGGVACTQAECIWLHLDLIGGLLKAAKSIFPNADYASCGVPTYPCGQVLGFASLHPPRRFFIQDAELWFTHHPARVCRLAFCC